MSRIGHKWRVLVIDFPSHKEFYSYSRINQQTFICAAFDFRKTQTWPLCLAALGLRMGVLHL